MRTIAIAAGALIAAAATSASAQVYYDRAYAYDPYYGNRIELRAGDECWNPGAGHFEAVRPGEVQNDLDFSRCRPIAGGYHPGYSDWRGYRDYGYQTQYRRECWNPRAGHYEEDRPGEWQGDLDYGRCRLVRW
jgi:hypothetical protein